jgi:N-formylglutamate deformylase
MVKTEYPGIPAIPLVCDSPHSGTYYPDDFKYSVDFSDLRRCEDTHVEKLWAAVPSVGGTLIHATFPRSYTDTNRTEFDVDVNMIAGTWPGRAEPSKRCLELGNGLFFSKTTTLQPIYDRMLSIGELQHRIYTCWRPYRQALARALEDVSQQHGKRWHLNLHSMPSNAYERLGLSQDKVLADVVLGDLRGAACSADFTAFVAQAFQQRGYSVAINDPYVGMDLLATHGKPEKQHHSLQIELNRSLYLNEKTREPLPQFGEVQSDIASLLADLASYVQQQL